MALRSTDASSGLHIGLILLAVGICIVDFVLSMTLMKNRIQSRYSALILQFWDLLLLSPLFLVGIMSLFSGGKGAAFGVTVLLLDLLLIFERSTSFVLRDPGRRSSDQNL